MLFFEDYPLVLMPVSCEPPYPAGHDQAMRTPSIGC
jgi:hypothetical protein